MPSPFFSIIIPTFNRRDFLHKAISTVIAQTFQDWELVVVDDGSTDNTEQMVRAFEDPRIHFIFQSNHGVAHARNQGLKVAKGQWVAFLDSDDWWLPQKLNVFAQNIDHNPDIKIFHSEETWFRQGELLNQKSKHQKPDGWVYLNALPLCCISISTAVIHNSVLEQVGHFDESLPACEDYDFWLRATHTFEVKLIPEYLTEKEGGREDQLSSQPGLDQYRVQALAKMLRSGALAPEEFEATRKELCKKARVFVNGAQKRGRVQAAQETQALFNEFA